MTKEQNQIREFMLKAGQDCPAKPTIPDLKTRILRAKVMLEECLESINDGLGLAVLQETGLPEGKFLIDVDCVEFVDVQPVDLVELADGLGDGIYVVKGTAVACGIDLEPIFESIHASNIDKFRDGCIRDEFGKVRKPKDWQPPDLKSIIEKQSSIQN